MKKIDWKKWKKNIPGLVFLLLLLGTVVAVQAQSTAQPVDPIQGVEEQRSHMLLMSTPTMTLSDDLLSQLNDMGIEHAGAQTAEEETKAETQQQAAEQDKAVATPGTEKKKTDSQSGTKKKQNTTNNGSNKDDSSKNQNNADKNGTTPSDGIVYFTTSIKNGETVDHQRYPFTVNHKRPELEVISTTVTLNNGEEADYDGMVLLVEGKNTIKVTAVYRGTDKKKFSVSRTYTVYADTENIVLTTSLKADGETVDHGDYSFTASAAYLGSSVPVKVTQNGTELPGDGTYAATLQEGANEFVLSAVSGEKSTQQTYTVTYEPPKELALITDLEESMNVSESPYGFQAYLENAAETDKLVVEVNGQTITGSGADYLADLNVGSNTIILKVMDMTTRTERQRKTCELVFTRPIFTPDDEGNLPAEAPTMSTNISEGMVVDSNPLVMDVTPVDYHGNRIPASGVAVNLNDSPVSYEWDTAKTTSFSLSLVSGENTIDITLTDDEGYSAIYRYTIICNVHEDGDEIGTITMSVEATTVGLGQLIPPTEVTILQGESLVSPLLRLLDQCGYGYVYDGSPDSGFYLKHLTQSGITNGAVVDQALIDEIQAAGYTYSGDYNPDSLGEFDFSQGSGWMYQYNGAYAGMGLSAYTPQNGDVIRVRYTLAYGRDIGDGGQGNPFSQEW